MASQKPRFPSGFSSSSGALFLQASSSNGPATQALSGPEIIADSSQSSASAALQGRRVSSSSDVSAQGSFPSTLAQQALRFNGSNGVHDNIYVPNNQDIKSYLSGLSLSEAQKYLQTKDPSGKTPLHHAAIIDDLSLLESMIKKSTPENLFIRDKEGKIFFHYLMIYAQCRTDVQVKVIDSSNVRLNLISILNLIIKKIGSGAFEQLVNIEDRTGNPALFYAAKFNEDNWPFLYVFLRILPDKRVGCLLKKIDTVDTLLHYLARRENPNLLIQILKLLSVTEMDQLLMEPNDAGQTNAGGGEPRAAAAAAAEPKAASGAGETIFDILIKLGREQHKFDEQKCEEIYYTIPRGRFDVIIEILDLFSEQDIVRILSTLDQTNKSLLHKAAESNALVDFLEMIEPQNRAICLNTLDANHNTALYYVSRREDPEELVRVISMIPPNQRFSIVKKQNVEGEDIFFNLINCPDISLIKRILELLKTFERSILLTRVDTHQESLLHDAAEDNPYLLFQMLQTLPRDQIFSGLAQQNSNHNTPLHLLAKQSVRYLHEVLKLLNQNELFLLIKMFNKEFKTIIHILIKNGNAKSIQLALWILQNISEAERLLLLKIKDNSVLPNATPIFLYCVVHRAFDLLVRLLALVDPRERKDYLIMPTITGKTLIQHMLQRSQEMLVRGNYIEEFINLMPDRDKALIREHFQKQK